jgi:hypothetical protein
MTTGYLMVIGVANPSQLDGRGSSEFPLEGLSWGEEQSLCHRCLGVCIGGASLAH